MEKLQASWHSNSTSLVQTHVKQEVITAAQLAQFKAYTGFHGTLHPEWATVRQPGPRVFFLKNPKPTVRTLNPFSFSCQSNHYPGTEASSSHPNTKVKVSRRGHLALARIQLCGGGEFQRSIWRIELTYSMRPLTGRGTLGRRHTVVCTNTRKVFKKGKVCPFCCRPFV